MRPMDYIKKFIRNYLIIFAIIVITITLLRQIFIPEKYIELKDIFIYMLCALVGNLPSLIFYSPKEISEKEMRFRIILHFLVLEAVLIFFGYIMGLVKGSLSIIQFAFEIAVIYVLVRFLTWIDDRKAADRINERLKSMKDEPGYESEKE